MVHSHVQDNLTLDNYDEVFMNLRGAVSGATIGEQEQTTGTLPLLQQSLRVLQHSSTAALSLKIE